jgi:phospholipase C
VVVVTMENRSFDHFLGWLAGADGLPPGLMYTDRKGVSHPSHPLASDFTGCPHPSPDHSYDQSRVAYDDGKMDGFLRAGSNDEYAIGYYTQADIPFYSALAQNYLACDRYFASILGPTLPNRLFQWAAQTDRLDDSVTFSSLPTILDRLSGAGGTIGISSQCPLPGDVGCEVHRFERMVGGVSGTCRGRNAAGGLVCRPDLYGIG